MNRKGIILILVLMITLTLIGCGQGTKEVAIKKGLTLELIGVDKNYEKVFYDNFKKVEEAHNNLIYRKSNFIKNDLREAFTEDRPDLANAKMIYDALKNKVEFIYYYSPKTTDLHLLPDLNTLDVRLASYMLIGSEIWYYIDECKNTLAQSGIMMQSPSIYITFFVNNDKYLRTHLPSQFVIEYYIKNPGDDPVVCKGQYVSGIGKAYINTPQKTVTGGYGPEYAIIKFFGTDINALRAGAVPAATQQNAGIAPPRMSTNDSSQNTVSQKTLNNTATLLADSDMPLAGLRVRVSKIQDAIKLLGNYAKVETNKEHGIDIYDFDGIKITDNRHFIVTIRVTDPRYKTKRGLKVGDTLAKVQEVYGKPGLIIPGEDFSYYKYYWTKETGGERLTFIVDKNGIIIGIVNSMAPVGP